MSPFHPQIMNRMNVQILSSRVSECSKSSLRCPVMLVVGDNAPAEEGVVSLSALYGLSVLSNRHFMSPLSELMLSDDFLQNTVASKKL